MKLLGVSTLIIIAWLGAVSLSYAEGPVFETGYNCTFSWGAPTTRVGGAIVCKQWECYVCRERGFDK